MAQKNLNSHSHSDGFNYHTNLDENIAHDFTIENIRAMYFTGWIIPKTPLRLFISSVLLLAFQYGLYIFLLIIAGYTISVSLDRKDVIMRIVNPASLLALAVVLPPVKHSVDKSLIEATQIIKNGIFKYKSEVSFDSHYGMKKTRVFQIRFILRAFIKMLATSAMFNIFILPFIQWLTLQDPSNLPFNPYLPLPFYMPFNTNTFLGYLLAFLPHAIFFIFFYSSVFCLEVIYISYTVQLITHIEILNFSLENIEKRAMEKYKQMASMKHDILPERLYGDICFQKCLYFCLRENILHHQAILRFKKAISPYLEAINGLAIIFFSIIMASSIFLILENPSMNIGLLMILGAEILCYFLICFTGEMITDKSNETAHSLYSTPWPQCDENFKILLKIMAIYLKQPLILRATGFSSICSLETFGDMMTVGYKLLSILR